MVHDGFTTLNEESGELHGGRLAAARRAFPHAAEPFIDLSTGINPVPYPLPDFAPDVLARLPEPEAQADLEQAAAEAYGAHARELVAAAPGTQILINLLPRLFPARSVSVVSPTYSEHASCWRAAGAEVRAIGATGHCGDAQVVVLCNPNNPDGRRHDPANLERLAERQAERDGLVVVDEAFADFEDGPLSVVPLLPRRGLLVLRSFGKAYGLAGLRLGFLLGDVAAVQRVRQALGPWAVSGPALVAGRAALRDAAWRDRARRRLVGDAARLDDLLAKAGLAVMGGTSLFRLAVHGDAAAVYQRLGKAGILVRRFPEQPTWLRFGLPADDVAWNRLRQALLALSRSTPAGARG